MDYFSSPLTTTFETPNGPMTLVGTTFPAFTTLDEIQRGVVQPEVVFLSGDGRHWLDSWHRGEDSGEAVYVERHVRGGCVFHGWVDKDSRQIVQVG